LGQKYRSTRSIVGLSETEVELFDKLNGHLSIEHLIANQPSNIDSLNSWQQLGIIEYIDKGIIQSNYHLLVLEPHMDDAALSVGGAMFKRKNKQKITIMTVVGESDFTSYSKQIDFTTEFVTKRRLRESDMACQMLNAKHVCLDELDQPIRWRTGKEADLASSEKNLLLGDKLAANIIPLNIDELWVPLAIEFHADHHRTRNAAISMLNKYTEAFQNVKVFFYEDVPYVNDFCERFKSDMILHLSRGNEQPQLYIEDISEQLSPKKKLSNVFGSQFKASYIYPKIEQAARIAADGLGYAERLWYFEHLPKPFEEDFFENFGDVQKLYQTLMGNDRVILFYNDFFVRGDFELFLNIFSHLTIDLFVPELESKRVDSINSGRVNLTIHPDGIDALINCIRKYSLGDEPIIVSNYQLQWEDTRNMFNVNSNNKLIYKSCWFSSLVIGLRKAHGDTCQLEI
jgi:LmbE family N-acetylglucosaminyl deacetylase